MSDNTLPANLVALLTGLRDDPSLAEGATAAVGELSGTQRAEAAATYYRSAGFEVTAEEIIALEIARKNAVGEPLSEDELEAVAGGGFVGDAVGQVIDMYANIFHGINKWLPW